MEEARVATVVVDTNSGEDFIFDKLGAKLGEARVSRRRLDVGDVHIACDGRLLIVERKSWADLQSSLTDGRLREQKARQMAAVAETPGARVIWLINGQLHSWHATVPPASLPAGRAEAALINAAVGDDIPVLRARDDEGVVETLAHLATKLEAGRLDGGAAAQARLAHGYSGVVKSKKSANTEDPRTLWTLMLASLRGVSAGRAAAIAELYPTPAALTDAVRAAGGAVAATKRLADTPVAGKRLGPAIAKRLANMFC